MSLNLFRLVSQNDGIVTNPLIQTLLAPSDETIALNNDRWSTNQALTQTAGNIFLDDDSDKLANYAPLCYSLASIFVDARSITNEI